MKTTLAIPVWKDHVSSTFDFARSIYIVELDGEREVARKEIELDDCPIAMKVQAIRDAGAQVTLCGAISRSLAQALGQAGIQIIPFASGQIDRVIAAYVCNRLSDPCFMQPGCHPGARRRWRQGGKAYTSRESCRRMHRF
ncbi:MAG: NifB/NifX family molybdenum-iron cluster-binding protein [Kiritimatiellae bacterium]|nr:NifB/NifX family molybdenum-iron cluster-binding protein [Kiritimatiellia bacterium]